MNSPLPPGAALRVLVLDDDMISRLVLAELVRSLDHAADESESADDALARAVSGRYDLLLVDLSMPGADGFEILRRLRQNETGLGRAPLPVVAVTGMVAPEDHARTAAAGFAGHLDKPVQRTTLRDLLARFAPAAAPAAAPASAAPELDGAALTDQLLGLAEQRGGDGRFLDLLAHAFAERSADLIAQLAELAGRGSAGDAQTRVRERLRGCALALGLPALARQCLDAQITPAQLGARFAEVATALARIVEQRHPALPAATARPSN